MRYLTMLTGPRKLPRYLYKYRPITDRTADILCKGELYFSTPEKLNDPFECKPVLTTSFTKASWRKAIRAELVELHPDYSGDQLRAELQSVFDTGYPPSRTALESFEHRYRSRLEKVGIFSVTERFDSIVMWSHYAEGHRGICLELDTNMLPEGTNCWPVRYSGKKPTINLFSDRKCANLIASTTKTADWRYEAEWRIVKGSQPGQPEFPLALDAPPGFIHAVIFGGLINSDSRAKVLDWMKHLKPAPDVYEAYLDERRYRVGRKPFSD